MWRVQEFKIESKLDSSAAPLDPEQSVGRLLPMELMVSDEGDSAKAEDQPPPHSATRPSLQLLKNAQNIFVKGGQGGTLYIESTAYRARDSPEQCEYRICFYKQHKTTPSCLFPSSIHFKEVFRRI